MYSIVSVKLGTIIISKPIKKYMGFKPLSACFVSLFYNGFHFTVKHLKEWNSGTYFFLSIILVVFASCSSVFMGILMFNQQNW